jgi:magnesium transporter
VDQHDEVELLLEAYVKQIDGIVQEADQLVSNMRNTEEIVNIIHDANRNSLMLLDLKVRHNPFSPFLSFGLTGEVSMTTLGIGSGAAIAGLLGMNIKNFLENWEYGFPVVTSFALGTSALICIIGLTRLRKIQKLTLYGRYPGSKKTEMNPWDMGDRGCDGEVERLKELKKLKWRLWWGVGRRREDVERERVKWWKRLWKVRAHR